MLTSICHQVHGQVRVLKEPDAANHKPSASLRFLLNAHGCVVFRTPSAPQYFFTEYHTLTGHTSSVYALVVTDRQAPIFYNILIRHTTPPTANGIVLCTHTLLCTNERWLSVRVSSLPSHPQFNPIQPRPIPSHPIPPDPISSHPIPSHPIPSQQRGWWVGWVPGAKLGLSGQVGSGV